MKKIILFSCFALSVLLCGCRKNLAGRGKYSYRIATDFPSTWSPTDWTSPAEKNILELTKSSLYDFVLNNTKDGYEIVCEMATSLPVDVTKNYAGEKKYGVPADATEGYAWKIDLINYATWEDETPIDASTFEYSLKQFLNPQMKNLHGKKFAEENLPIVNAKKYFQSEDSAIYSDIKNLNTGKYADVPDEQMYVSLTKSVVFFCGNMESYHKTYPEKFVDSENEIDLYEQLVLLTEDKIYCPLTSEIKSVLEKIAVAFNKTDSNVYKEFCFSKKEKNSATWEDVGFIKNDDYSFTLVLNKKMSLFELISNCDIPLLKENLYEENKSKIGGVVKSNYGTSIEKYCSYGPYKIVEFNSEKICFQKNESWYGWTDEKHVNQFETTDYEILFGKNSDEQLELFINGELDAISVTTDDVKKLPEDSKLLLSPSPYVLRLSVNSEKSALKKRNAPGINHSILSYSDFRKAISLCLNRKKYMEEIAPFSSAELGLINNYFYSEPDASKIYRNTPQAKLVLQKIYGSEIMENGFESDVDFAKILFNQSYEQALENGDIKSEDKIQIDFQIPNESFTETADFLQDCFNLATAGTLVEEKIKLNISVDKNYYVNIKNGETDMVLTTCAASAFDPYSLLWNFCDSAAVCEYGFNPLVEKFSVDLDGKKITKTYNQWYKELCFGEYENASSDVKNSILAAAEEDLLAYYGAIPLCSVNSAELKSGRIEEGSGDYVNHLVAFGGLRFMKFTMDDADWTSFNLKKSARNGKKGSK